MAQTPLYRPEAIEAKRNRWLGRLILRQPVSHWVLTWCAIALVAVAVVFLWVGEYARKVRVDGQLVADVRPVDISAPTEGVLAALRYREGDRVERNAVVAEIRIAQADRTTRVQRLHAPQAGRVSALHARIGTTIIPGRPVLSLTSDEASLEAELYLPDRLLESSAVGSEVLLRYRAFPYQRYGQYRGRIASIAYSPLRASQARSATGTANNDLPLYRAIVEIDQQSVRSDRGQRHELRPGLRLQADIVLEKRRLYEWLLEPFARWRERSAGSRSTG
jgi:multidrug efflux pump subunit AcrA (membrane-fusion protein)